MNEQAELIRDPGSPNPASQAERGQSYARLTVLQNELWCLFSYLFDSMPPALLAMNTGFAEARSITIPK